MISVDINRYHLAWDQLGVFSKYYLWAIRREYKLKKAGTS